MARSLIALAMLGLTLPALADNLTWQTAQRRAGAISGVSYALSLVVGEGSETYHATSTVRFTLTTACDLPLDFRWGSIESLGVNGIEAPLPAAGGRVLEIPATALRAGENAITVTYTNPYDRDGKGLQRFVDPVDGKTYLYTQFEPFDAHRVLPCFDQPDLKAVFRLEIDAPTGWRAISNSPEALWRRSGARTVHVFGPTRPISTYLFFAGAGPFAAFADARAVIPTRIFARQSMAQYVKAQETFDTIRAGLAFFGDYYGIPYPFPKYDQLYVPEFSAGAMENAGAITFNERYLYRHSPTRLDRQRHASVILHEMAHQWFGDLVTLRWWDALWLNESFATAMSLEALLHATPFTHALEEQAAAKAGAYREDQLPTTHPIEAQVPDTDSARAQFDGITYGKGAALLRQLQFFLGPETFRKGLHTYLSSHAWGNATADDFFAAMGKERGESLADWRHLHFQTAGVDRLQIVRDGGTPEGGGSAGRGLVLAQEPASGDPVVRPQRLTVAEYPLASEGSGTVEPVLVDVRLAGERTSVPVAVPPGSLGLVWPNAGEHAYAVVRLDPTSLAWVRTHSGLIADPVTRRGVWASLYQMVRDSLLGPDAFDAMAIEELGRLDDPDLARQIIGSVQHTIVHYLTGDVTRMTRRAFDLAMSKLPAAPRDSDAQKLWLDLAIDMALDPMAQSTLERWLDSGGPAPGVLLDPDRRWRALIQLACMGRPGIRQRIAAERERDPSDAGIKRALQAEAILPEEAVKERVFQECLMDRTSSLSRMQAKMAGFHHFTQVALARIYFLRFFEAIGLVRATHDEEYLDAFVHAMYPAYLHEDVVLVRTNSYLAEHPGLPASVRKSLQQAADEMARALRVRAASAGESGGSKEPLSARR